MILNKADKTKAITLIHHAAQGFGRFPPSSLAALKSCLEGGALAVEVDIIPLLDGEFVLLHDPQLQTSTNGAGNAARLTRQDLQSLYYKVDGAVTDEGLGFLDQALDLVEDNCKLGKLQLDLKPYSTLTPPIFEGFLRLIEPVRERVQVSCVGDWVIRSLHQLSPGLNLGFDPLLYLDVVEDEPRSEGIPPFRVGTYGYLDDHPLSAQRWGELKEYFAARAEALLVQAVPGCEWFIHADLLANALEAGFNWIGCLHEHGHRVDAWTLDPDKDECVALANKLVKMGVDEITSNDPVGLSRLLDSEP